MNEKLLGRCIKIHRIKKGLTQAELAEAVNVATGMIGRYERGEKMPGRDVVFELAKILEFSLDALVFESKSVEKNVFAGDINEKLNKLTEIEQKAAFNAAEAVINTFLEE